MIRALSMLLTAVLLTSVGKPRFVLRPFVDATACRTNRRGGHDRELVGSDYLDTGGDSMPGRRAVDHDDTHDLLLLFGRSNRAQNLGDGVTRRGIGDLLKSGCLLRLPQSLATAPGAV